MNTHAKFIGRTVLTKNQNYGEAYRLLNRVLVEEGLFALYKRTRRYEKPFNVRRRINYEICKSIYDEDMKRKIDFIMKKNRLDPYPGR